jgi:hypothetical protein
VLRRWLSTVPPCLLRVRALPLPPKATVRSSSGDPVAKGTIIVKGWFGQFCAVVAPVAICSRRGHGLRDRYAARDVEPQGRDHSGHQRERCQCIESAGEAASYVFDPTDNGRPKKAT